MGADGSPGDQVKNEVATHLNALKGYVDMKFDVLKGMLSGKKKKEEESSTQLRGLEATMRKSMLDMENA